MLLILRDLSLSVVFSGKSGHCSEDKLGPQMQNRNGNMQCTRASSDGTANVPSELARVHCIPEELPQPLAFASGQEKKA